MEDSAGELILFLRMSHGSYSGALVSVPSRGIPCGKVETNSVLMLSNACLSNTLPKGL